MRESRIIINQWEFSMLLCLQNDALGIAIQSPTSQRSVFARAEHTPHFVSLGVRREMNVVMVIIITNCSFHVVTSCTCLWVCVHLVRMYAHIYIYIYNYIYICVCVYLFIYLIYLSIYSFIHLFIYLFIYLFYIYIYSARMYAYTI